LAIIETGGTDTPYFAGLNTDELVTDLAGYLIKCESEFQHGFFKSSWEKNGFLNYLKNSSVLNINPDEVHRLIYELIKKGEMDYEFRTFKRVGLEDKRQGNTKNTRS